MSGTRSLTMYTSNLSATTKLRDTNIRTVRKRVDLAVLGRIPVNPAQASQGILPVNVHGATSTDTLPARPPKRQRRVHLILDLDERIENHRPCLVQVDLIRLQLWFLLWMFWVPSVDFELLLENRFLGGRRQRARTQSGNCRGPQSVPGQCCSLHGE